MTNCTQAVSWAACTGSYTKFIQSAAANAFGAPLGITIVSYQLIPPSSGITNWMSGRSYCICTTSPDQAMHATKSPLSRLRMYSLPVKARI